MAFWPALKEEWAHRNRVLRGADGKHKVAAGRIVALLVLTNVIAYGMLLVASWLTGTAFPAAAIIKNGELLVVSIALVVPAIQLFYHGGSSGSAKAAWPLLLGVVITLLIGLVFALVKVDKVADNTALDFLTWLCVAVSLYLNYLGNLIQIANEDPTSPPEDKMEDMQ